MIVARSCSFTTDTSKPGMNTPIRLQGEIARTNCHTRVIQRGRIPSRSGSRRYNMQQIVRNGNTTLVSSTSTPSSAMPAFCNAKAPEMSRLCSTRSPYLSATNGKVLASRNRIRAAR